MIRNTLVRLRTVLTAAPTYLAALAVIVGIVVDEVLAEWDVPWVATVGAIALTTLAVASRIVRRVTPVLPSERGLLPPPPR